MPWRALRGAGIGLAVLVVLLIVARLLAPIAVKRYVNRVLDRANGYHGEIGDVDLALWRGAYQIENLDIVKDEGKVPVPLLRAPLVDLSVQWHELIHGALVGEIWLDRPELNFVTGPSAGDRQNGSETDWREVVKKLMPIKINRLTARDGSIHFRSFRMNPPFDVSLRDVELVATNLTNSEDLAEDHNLVARAHMTARPMDSGRLEARVAIDPYADQPTFDLDLALTGVALKQFNDLFRAYAKVDVDRGTLRLYSELTAEKGHFRGYIKPFFVDVDVLGENEAEHQSVLKDLWEGAVGAVADVFKDQKDDRVATRIPISGTVESPQYGFWATLGNVVRNAFVSSFVPALEHSVGEEKG